MMTNSELVSRLVLIAAIALTQEDCASQPTVMVDGQKRPVNAAAEDAYQAAKQKEAQGDSEGAKKDLKKIAQDYAGADKAADAQFELGELSFKQGRFAEAQQTFADFLLRYPTHRMAPRARRLFAKAAIAQGRFRDAAETLKTVLPETSGDERREVAAELLQAANAVGDAGGQVMALAEQLGAAQTDAEREPLRARIIGLIEHDLRAADINKLLASARGGPLSFALDSLLVRAGLIAFHVGDMAAARPALEEVVSRGANPQYVEAAKNALAQIAEIGRVRAGAIGVVLPLSGDKKDFGQASLIAIKLAFGIDPENTSGGGVELVVRDSGGDADKAASAVVELVTKEHVMALLGPLFSEESLSAAAKAESFGVPMINLSRRDGIPQVGPNVFRLCMTPKQQIDALAHLAFDILGFKRFAMIYPNVQIGTEMANLFWDAVDARKGEIRGAETFDYDQTTFMTPVKKLVGRQYLEARGDYLKTVQDIYENKSLTGIKKQKAQEQALKQLPPVTDFDAIFIPGNPKQVGYIAPALAFEDVVTTLDKEELKRIAKTTGRENLGSVRLLGTSTWNSPKTVERGSKYVEGAIFVDGFFAQDGDPKVQRFVKNFTEAAHREPTLPDAQAFDAASIIREVLKQNPADRATLRRAIEGVKNFAGVTGKISFDADGEAQKQLYYLTIEKGQIVRFDELTRGASG